MPQNCKLLTESAKWRVDLKTSTYYAEHAADIAARYESVASPVAMYFSLAFAHGARVLDVGAGSGRDLAALLKHGFEGFGVEPSAGFREAAASAHPELSGRLADAALPNLGEPFGGGFDGVLCSAVLMHLPEADLFDSAFALRRALKPHGRLLISLPAVRPDLGADDRDVHGRLFKPYTAGYIQLLFERLGFQLIGNWETDDALQRARTRWTTLLFELRAGGPLRAVDQIEGILNRDRKVATYKLALFRALAEIAIQEPPSAQWRTTGEVAVPIARIAERWLIYFWPIFASQRFVPQSQSEGAGAAKPLAFRATMSALMQAFAGQGEHGGLSAWHSAWTTGSLPVEVVQLQMAALRRIADAIRYGPVAFSGGSLETGAVFGYDSAARTVLMSGELWRELSLLGHWIVDAVIVRWASLTERFAHRQAIGAGDVLPLLLARPSPDRTTALARQIFIASGVDRCTWSDRPISPRRFAVDHVIPFSLWGNNDLWNLVPADAGINGLKSDKLPHAELLMHRRAAIVLHWNRLRDATPEAFDRQAAHLLGRAPGGVMGWENDLFGCLRQAVELTALQRGIERWSPANAVM